MNKLLLLSTIALLVAFTACNKLDVINIQNEILDQNISSTGIDAALTAAFTIDNDFGEVNEQEDLLITNRSSSNVVSYEWDFGNGQTSTEANPSYQYEMHGYYTVKLKVTDDRGNTKEASQNVQVLCIFGGGDHNQ